MTQMKADLRIHQEVTHQIEIADIQTLWEIAKRLNVTIAVEAPNTIPGIEGEGA